MTGDSGWSRLRNLGSDVAAGFERMVRSVRAVSAPEPSRPTAARLGAAAVLDEALLTTFQIVRSPTDQDHFAPQLDEANELIAHLRADPAAADAGYHVRPAPASFTGTERQLGHVRFHHAAFASAYAPSPTVPGAERFAEQTDNRVAHAWILGHDHAAPWIVCVHGAGMGDPLVDIFAFRAGALHRAGFNVAIPVLPHHGPRGSGRLATAFPTDDAVLNFHGAAQAIADVRAVLATIATREEPAMLLGISLGGYVAAAVAALEPALRGVVVGVPVTDLAMLLRRHAPPRFARHPLFEPMCDASHALEAWCSPLSLPVPATPVRRVWAGRADRLVHPDQVERIIEHWAAEGTWWYTGGHVGFLGRPSVQHYVGRALVDAGLGELHRGRLRARPIAA